MPGKNRHDISQEFLFRHFAGELSDTQEKEVTDWRGMSDKNEIEYREAQLFYLDVKALGSLRQNQKSYDTNAAWNKLDISKPTSGVHLFVPSQMMKIAASIVIIFGLGWFTYQKLFTSQQMVLLADDVIVQEELADGSKVSLNKGAELTYPDKFLIDTREVTLMGEAYFEIEPDPKKPFIVRTKDVDIRVLGTAFNVIADPASDTVSVFVDEGLVKLVTDEENEELQAGTSAIFVRSTRSLIKMELGSVSTHNFWRTKVLVYNGSTLKEVTESLQEAYGVNISLANPKLSGCRITVAFEHAALEDVLSIVAATLNLELSKKGDDYQLFGKGCDL